MTLRVESAVREFSHDHDNGVCRPDCYGCFIIREAKADIEAENANLRAELEKACNPLITKEGDTMKDFARVIQERDVALLQVRELTEALKDLLWAADEPEMALPETYKKSARLILAKTECTEKKEGV